MKKRVMFERYSFEEEESDEVDEMFMFCFLYQIGSYWHVATAGQTRYSTDYDVWLHSVDASNGGTVDWQCHSGSGSYDDKGLGVYVHETVGGDAIYQCGYKGTGVALGDFYVVETDGGGDETECE